MDSSLLQVGVVQAGRHQLRLALFQQRLNNGSGASAGQGKFVAQWLGWYSLNNGSLSCYPLVLRDAWQTTEFQQVKQVEPGQQGTDNMGRHLGMLCQCKKYLIVTGRWLVLLVQQGKQIRVQAGVAQQCQQVPFVQGRVTQGCPQDIRRWPFQQLKQLFFTAVQRTVYQAEFIKGSIGILGAHDLSVQLRVKVPHGTTTIKLYTNFIVCAMNGVPVELFGTQDFLPDLDREQLTAIFGLPVVDAYKESCIKRRVASRIRRSGCRDVNQYLQLLGANPAERERLNASLMIHVSQFFRNPSLFKTLQTVVLPALVRRAAGQPQRYWSIGCAAGEEPYSLVILLAELYGEQAPQVPFEILATDIDSSTLARARSALYAASSLREVSADRQARFFSETEGGFLLCPQVRSMVRFRQMDLQQIESYPLADLVLCRNTLIYFKRSAQEKILHAIADILPQNGILVLGKSESMPASLRGRFAAFDPVERIYSRR